MSECIGKRDASDFMLTQRKFVDFKRTGACFRRVQWMQQGVNIQSIAPRLSLLLYWICMESLHKSVSDSSECCLHFKNPGLRVVWLFRHLTDEDIELFHSALPLVEMNASRSESMMQNGTEELENGTTSFQIIAEAMEKDHGSERSRRYLATRTSSHKSSLYIAVQCRSHKRRKRHEDAYGNVAKNGP